MKYNVVDIVSSGMDALKTINTNKIDLILMDLLLEGEMNGIDTAIEIRDKHWDIPIIYSTSYPQELTHDKIKETEPYDYLLKPFDH
ncbi:MAG: response regulator, partial [Methanobacterium sp.]